jgi:hypothetical protein
VPASSARRLDCHLSWLGGVASQICRTTSGLCVRACLKYSVYTCPPSPTTSAFRTFCRQGLKKKYESRCGSILFSDMRALSFDLSTIKLEVKWEISYTEAEGSRFFFETYVPSRTASHPRAPSSEA